MNQFDRGGHQTVKRWTRKIDLFDKDIIFFPVNLANMHWVLAVINKRKKRFEYYDSLAGPDPGVLAKLRRYYKDEYRAKNNEDLDLAEWSDYQPDVPKQSNSSDCEAKAESVVFDFTAENMPYIRNMMVLEIVRKSFLPHQLD